MTEFEKLHPVYCPICHGEARFLFSTNAAVWSCQECYHVFSKTDVECAEVYGESYYSADHKNWFDYPNFSLFRQICNNFEQGATSILDVGCGRGAFLRFARDNTRNPLKLIGIDFSRNEMDKGIEYRMGDFSAVKPDEKFDVVVSLAVIEHVPDPVSFLGHMKSCCRPGGQIIVMTLDSESILYKTARLLGKVGILGPRNRLYSLHHLQHFTTSSLAETFSRAGLKLEKVWHHNSPLRSVDIPAKSMAWRYILLLGVAGMFVIGKQIQRTYLQTVIARV